MFSYTTSSTPYSLGFKGLGNYPPCDRAPEKKWTEQGSSHHLSFFFFNSPAHCRVIKKRELPNTTRGWNKLCKEGDLYLSLSLLPWKVTFLDHDWYMFDILLLFLSLLLIFVYMEDGLSCFPYILKLLFEQHNKAVCVKCSTCCKSTCSSLSH